jgi:hypothetical protein
VSFESSRCERLQLSSPVLSVGPPLRYVPLVGIEGCGSHPLPILNLFESNLVTPVEITRVIDLMPVMIRIEDAVLAYEPEARTTRSGNSLVFELRGREVKLVDEPLANGRLMVAGPKTAQAVPVDLNQRFDSESIELGARLVIERLKSPYFIL